MLYALPFPQIDPVLFSVGPLAIRWYSLGYIAGFVLGWWIARQLVSTPALWGKAGPACTREGMDDAIVWAALCGILGGRLAFVFVYNFDLYRHNLLEVFAVWHGGMAFHGGIAGTIIGLYLFSRRNNARFLGMLDLAGTVAPLGIMLVRLANFIKGELWGRPSDLPWAMVFPDAGPEPRHPSQIYQALMEGLLLFLIVQIFARLGGLKKPGFMAGMFGAGYGTFRIIGEFFREPDRQLGFLAFGVTMGQLLSLPVLFAGLWLMLRAREPQQEAA